MKTGISILIPIFNFDVRLLVRELLQQCEQAGCEHEILCFDDCSSHHFKRLNCKIAGWNCVVYREMPENLGRSAIRNTLGKAANFSQLLFLDCDSRVVHADFIEKYWLNATPHQLVYGGRSYSSHPPANPNFFFHWKYGTKREQRADSQRSKEPYQHFMTNNFLIPKDIFLRITFDESLRGYGHEDTLFGAELSHRQVPILHITNELEHIGLEPVEVFLKKTQEGIKNLVRLQANGKKVETRLLINYQTLQKWGVSGFFNLIFAALEPLILLQLKSKSPNLVMFDVLKLGWLHRAFRESKVTQT